MKPFHPEHASNNLITFIRSTFKEAGFTDAVIAVSGGIDSAVSCTLAVKALGADHVFPLFLPYGALNKQGVEDASLVTTFLKIPDDHIQTVSIQPMVDQITQYDATISPLRKGNIMARMRMIILYDQAKKRKALVVGTENKTEHLLGYFTRFGDEASDVEPLRNLYKTQVYEVANYLQIPNPLITKAPTAGLWEGQTDEEEFGFSYKEADEILSMAVDEGNTAEEIGKMIHKGNIVGKVLDLMKRNGFKQTLPFISQIK